MKKIGIMTDSHSGILEKEAQENHIYVLPMPFLVNGDLHLEGVSMTRSEFYGKLREGIDVATSQPSPQDVMAMWDAMLTEYDEIVYIPISSGLSGSCMTAQALAQDEPYDGRVFVVDNGRCATPLHQSVLDAIKMIKAGYTAEQIRQRLEETKEQMIIYVGLSTLEYLKKGGRITPAAAALGTLLKLKPVLQIQGEKLDAFAKARTVKQAKQIMIDSVKNDLVKRFHDPKAEKMCIEIAYTYDLEAAEEFKREVLEVFPGHDIIMNPLSLSVSCHIGPGALALALARRVEV